MRIPARLALATTVVGAGFLLAAPAALAQQACAYPFDCPGNGGGDLGGGTGGAGTGGGTTTAGGGGGSGAGSAGGLPVTGGQTVLLVTAGAGTLAAGAALVVAGRRRTAQV